ncbi:MAG: DUF3467 domain-containing protein [ANME-2 cluster archaeon]|nr:DUF3467 domain-containing protein [ANME-2 cluster archaeon]
MLKKNVQMEVTKTDDFKQIYAIGAMGGHSPYDFRIAFYNDTPRSFGGAEGMQTIDRKVGTEVILSPAATKELLNWLSSHVNDYEKMFGPITTTSDVAMKSAKNEQPDSSQIQGYM